MLNIVKIKKKDLISPNNPCIRNNDIKKEKNTTFIAFLKV